MNTGDSNTGNWNTGDSNTGDMNTGNWNTGNRNTGYFNTINPPVMLFNKPTAVAEIVFPDYFYFKVPWTTGVSLFDKPVSFLWQKSFEKATSEEVRQTLQLPNFDYKIFEEITSITKKQLQERLNGKEE
jgi:hypothetical protein